MPADVSGNLNLQYGTETHRERRIRLYNGSLTMGALPSISELASRFRRGEVSPVEITRGCLERIEKLNPALNAFITVMAESALEQARSAEEAIGRGEWRGPLHGVPVAVKDLIDTAGVRTTAASAVHENRIPTEDADVVRRLRVAGAVIVGKKQSARIRIRWKLDDQPLRRGTQSVGSRSDRRGIIRRIGGRGGGRHGVTPRSGRTRRDRFASQLRSVDAWG